MKILFDCFSCSPYYGSDEGIGWLWPYYMRRYHEVWVLVRKDRRPDIERYCRENQIADIHFIYADIPDRMNLYYKHLKQGKNGTLDFLLYQYLWQFPTYRAAKRLHKQVKFDLVHHAGTNDFRLLGRLYRLNIPYVIGPIGGAQETPDALRYYVRDHQKSEKLRSLLNKMMSAVPGYSRALNRADRIFISNRETQVYLSSKIRDPGKCTILTEVGCTELPEKTCRHAQTAEEHVFTFMWAGRMEYRKGLELLFDVLNLLPQELQWQLILCGDGSERSGYEAMLNQSLSKHIVFVGKVPYEEMNAYYDRADAFVFPSLRETTGTVIIEAMARGIPVIALKQGGAAEVITEDSGDLISGSTREEILAHFKSTLENCIRDPQAVYQKGAKARERILSHYTWEEKAKYMNRIYHEICNID